MAATWPTRNATNGLANALPASCEREAQEITTAKKRNIARRPRLAVSIASEGGKVTVTGGKHADKEGSALACWKPYSVR